MINSRDIKDNFYVYIHVRHDNMEPFYVGKGRGDRAYRKIIDLSGGLIQLKNMDIKSKLLCLIYLKKMHLI